MDESRDPGTDTPQAGQVPAAPEASPLTPQVIAPPPRLVPTREYRATMTFAISAAFVLLALLIVSTNSGSSNSTSGAYLAAVLSIVTSGLAALGLSNQRGWARFAMTPMLWIYVIGGAAVFLIALARGGINIPIGALLGAWSLSAQPAAALGQMPGSSTEGMLLIVGVAVAELIQFA